MEPSLHKAFIYAFGKTANFGISKNLTVQHVSVNALDTGRNANEVLRTLRALQAGNRQPHTN